MERNWLLVCEKYDSEFKLLYWTKNNKWSSKLSEAKRYLDFDDAALENYTKDFNEALYLPRFNLQK